MSPENSVQPMQLLPLPASIPIKSHQLHSKAHPAKSNHNKSIKTTPRRIAKHRNSVIPIEAQFIREFTKEIIIAMKKQRKFSRISHPIMDIQVPPITSSAQKNVTIMFQSQPTEQKIVSDTPRVLIESRPYVLPGKPVSQIRPINWSRQGLPAPRPQIPVIQQTQAFIKQISLDKIKSILSSPAVFSLECPGSGKPLVTISRGISNVTNQTLTDEEINAFMKDISQKTRIPLTTGLFKAVFGNLLITAVISDFVGTRFIIQKRA